LVNVRSAGRLIARTVPGSDSNAATQDRGNVLVLFLHLLPAFVLAMFVVRIAELAAGVEPGTSAAVLAALIANALALDLINLLRHLPLLFLYSLPFLLFRSRRGRTLGLGIAWSLLVLLQAGLVQYFLTARLPLGADLFAYSPADVQNTLVGGLGLRRVVIAGVVIALIGLWLGLINRSLTPSRLPRNVALATFALALAALLLVPSRFVFSENESEDASNLELGKLAYFVDDNLAYLTRSETVAPPAERTPATAPEAAVEAAGFRYLDPDYPFLHAEQTPDVLGPLFNVRPGLPPNLVFVIVEGLGRSFSGPDASLGSFTPELDRLSARSLYWENFLAVQGRTFGVLPSVFGSLPFGENGFAKLGDRMPAHDTLLSILKGQGYRLKFYSGFDANFDNERNFLKRQGIDVLIDRYNFGDDYGASNSWGYADGDLFSRVLASEAHDNKQPFVSVISTVTMHTPYTFPGQAAYSQRFEHRLAELGISEARKDSYRANQDIYTSIQYADEAMGRFFREAEKNPAFQNTIFIVFGDHRLPEIPMTTRIERYHVPLIIFSPLLKAPVRIKSVSSHFDLTPSLLAFLSHNYGVKTPQEVAWLGSGLDTEPSFRNIHRFPLKQTKTNLVDYVSGTWFINRDRLYALNDGMNIEPTNDAAALARIQGQFTEFRRANDQFARSLALLPRDAGKQVAEYKDADRAQPPTAALVNDAVLSVSEVHSPEDARVGPVSIDVVFANTGSTTSETFIPVVVLVAENGKEVSEAYGTPQRLLAGETISLQLPVNSQGVAPGHYFLAVVATHPRTGKRLGTGRHHIPIRFDG
jgi:phosphoglycerol transferase MdoB-like AlkP superfamily enzyme